MIRRYLSIWSSLWIDSAWKGVCWETLLTLLSIILKDDKTRWRDNHWPLECCDHWNCCVWGPWMNDALCLGSILLGAMNWTLDSISGWRSSIWETPSWWDAMLTTWNLTAIYLGQRWFLGILRKYLDTYLAREDREPPFNSALDYRVWRHWSLQRRFKLLWSCNRTTSHFTLPHILDRFFIVVFHLHHQ